jgi:hypothetical protein
VAGALAGAPFATLRLAALDGAEKWRRVGSGPTPGELRVADLRVSGNRIIVGGAARPPGTNQPFEFTVLGIDAKTGAFGVCGDGNVEGDEACDETSPCCTSSCQPAAGNGTTCRLADGCTAPGRCRAGRCSGGKRLPYAPCGACDPFRGSDAAYEPCGGCYGGTTFVPTLRSCREPIESRAAALVLAKTPRALHWRWRRGAATTSEELGDPLGGTGYALCAYATGVDGQPQSLLAFATAPGGAGWSRTPSGFRYRVGRPNGTGLRTLSLRSGQAGRAKIALDASGEDLLIPNLPLDAGIEVNLVRTDGSDVCWGVQHDFVRRNRARRFAATGPELP